MQQACSSKSTPSVLTVRLDARYDRERRVAGTIAPDADSTGPLRHLAYAFIGPSRPGAEAGQASAWPAPPERVARAGRAAPEAGVALVLRAAAVFFFTATDAGAAFSSAAGASLPCGAAT